MADNTIQLVSFIMFVALLVSVHVLDRHRPPKFFMIVKFLFIFFKDHERDI
jgi:hypothetical protein